VGESTLSVSAGPREIADATNPLERASSSRNQHAIPIPPPGNSFAFELRRDNEGAF